MSEVTPPRAWRTTSEELDDIGRALPAIGVSARSAGDVTADLWDMIGGLTRIKDGYAAMAANARPPAEVLDEIEDEIRDHLANHFRSMRMTIRRIRNELKEPQAEGDRINGSAKVGC